MKWASTLLLSILSIISTITAQTVVGVSTLENETFRAERLLDKEQAVNILDAVVTNVPDKALHPLFVRLLVAIRKSENGGDGRQFGVMHPKARTYRQQAGWCAATCWKRYGEWKADAGSSREFLPYLASRYAPLGASNDSRGLNANWFLNVLTWMEKP